MLYLMVNRAAEVFIESFPGSVWYKHIVGNFQSFPLKKSLCQWLDKKSFKGTKFPKDIASLFLGIDPRDFKSKVYTKTCI